MEGTLEFDLIETPENVELARPLAGEFSWRS